MRPGNVHSADGWRKFLSPIVDGYREMDKKLYLRGGAAFASPDIYEYLEDNSILYAIRLKANNNLYHEIDHLMTRPVGRPSRKPKVYFHAFSYRPASWKSSRRVIAKVEWHIDELFPRIGFIVTNMSSSPEAAVLNVVRESLSAVLHGCLDENLLRHPVRDNYGRTRSRKMMVKPSVSRRAYLYIGP